MLTETHNTFKALKAADIMQRDVVSVRRQDTLRDALALMTDNHVTGLPVMDGHSKCVGLVTATDILNYEQEHAGGTSQGDGDVGYHFDPDSQQWESMRLTSFALEAFGDVRVEEIMTHDLIAVDRDTSIQDVARKMRDGAVHRALVIDNAHRLYGIVSAIDIVNAVAAAT